MSFKDRVKPSATGNELASSFPIRIPFSLSLVLLLIGTFVLLQILLEILSVFPHLVQCWLWVVHQGLANLLQLFHHINVVKMAILPKLCILCYIYNTHSNFNDILHKTRKSNSNIGIDKDSQSSPQQYEQ